MATDHDPLDPRLAEAIRALRDAPPESDLWPGIAPRLQPRAIPGTVQLRWPTALAAVLAIVLASVGGTMAVLRRAEPSAPTLVTPRDAGLLVVSATATPADATLESAIAQVQTQLRSLEEKLDPTSRDSFARSLLLLDRAIAAATARRRAEPENLQAAHYVTATLRKKLDLLRGVAVLASTRS